jgi:hypothetical protein
MPWFRFYVATVRDRKVRRLAPEHRWLWVVILSVARQSPEPGRLIISDGDPWTVDDLADEAALTTQQVNKGIAAMLKMDGFIVDVGGVLEVVNWGKRQYESDLSTARVTQKRTKERQSNGDVTAYQRPINGDATSPDTDTDTDKIKPLGDSASLSLVPVNDSPPVAVAQKYPDDFAAFWNQYPRKTGKGAALKAWKKLRAGDRTTALAAIGEHAAAWAGWTPGDQQFIPHPATWLSQARYDDPPPAQRGQVPRSKADENMARIRASAARMGVGQ